MSEKQIRMWADGCYDLTHFGHANNLRQAKGLGDYLIVGVHSDAEILKHKSAAPVFTEDERYAMIRAIRWVDEVVEDAPYVTTIETLDKYKCDYCAHGNDITTTTDGTDTYQLVKDAGKYKEVERSQGVSTTDLVNRMLAVVRFEDDPPPLKEMEIKEDKCDDNNNEVEDSSTVTPTETTESTTTTITNQTPPTFSPWTGSSALLLTTKKITQFSINNQPKDDDKIVYVSGAFDIFHKGHLDFLEKAAKLGTFLIVGVHSDDLVNKTCGSKYPVMTLNERIYNLLGCRYVSDVLIAAPFVISKELIDHLNISVVAHGKTWEESRKNIPTDLKDDDPYEIPRKRNILKVVDSQSDLTAEKIVQRIRDNRAIYEERNRKKQEKERKIYQEQQQLAKSEE